MLRCVAVGVGGVFTLLELAHMVVATPRLTFVAFAQNWTYNMVSGSISFITMQLHGPNMCAC